MFVEYGMYDGYIIQTIYGYADNTIPTYKRTRAGGTWGPWKMQPTRAEVAALDSKMTSLSNDNRRTPKVIEYNNNASEPKTLNITLPQQAWSFMSILVLRPTAPVIISAHQNASVIYDANMKNIFTGELDSGVTYDGLVISVSTLGYETGYVFGIANSISLT